MADCSEDDETLVMSDLEERFSKAANHLQSMVSDLTSDQLLKFYGLYKQATAGSCDTPRPSWYQTQAKYKWDAWNALGAMTKQQAMENYIDCMTQLDPDWEINLNDHSKSWIAVSSLPNTDDELLDSDKTLLDWIKEGDEKKVVQSLLTVVSSVNAADDDGMLPIHWAADRGHLTIIKCLIENGADLNAQDDAGQTALHYAASCGHSQVVQYLLSLGAESIKDNDGLTPKDVADKQLIAMF